MKILIIKRDKIGDMLLTTPLIAMIKAKASSSDLHVLANTYNGWVVQNNPNVDYLWLYPFARRSSLMRKLVTTLQQFIQIIRLRLQEYDWIIVAGGESSPRANRRARMIAHRQTRIVAYCDLGQERGISDPLSSPTTGHEIERIIGLLVPMGIYVEAADIPMPLLFPSLAWIESAQLFLTTKRLKPHEYVVLGIGVRKRRKQPSVNQVLRWAQMLNDRFDLHTVFTWTPGKRDDPLYPGDDDLAEAVLTNCPDYLHPFQGELGTVVGLTWLAKTSIYPDSGLMHVAAASPGGVVGLFADPTNSSSPEIWGPKGIHAQTVVAPQRIADVLDETILSVLAKNLQ